MTTFLSVLTAVFFSVLCSVVVNLFFDQRAIRRDINKLKQEVLRLSQIQEAETKCLERALQRLIDK